MKIPLKSSSNRGEVTEDRRVSLHIRLKDRHFTVRYGT